jgi:LPS sulfotransferase NodH
MMDNLSTILDKHYIYIIGSPRSGTTWLQAMIGAHPKVTTTMELTMFTTYIKPLVDSWEQEMRPIETGKWRRGLPVLWTREEFRDFLVSFLERAYISLLKKNPQATHILDKNPVNSQMVEQIHWLVPKARFVHIIRDGRDVAISMVAARKSMGFGTDTIHASAHQWKDMLKAARKGQQYAGQYLEIRYEDLLAEPEAQMSRVFDFCGLSVTPAEIADIVHEHQFEKMKSEQRSPDPNIKGGNLARRNDTPPTLYFSLHCRRSSG